MNKLKIIPVVLGFALLSSLTYGQKYGDVSQMYLSGKWTAVCPIEVVDRVTLRSCELCPFIINPGNHSQAESAEIVITFMKDSLQLYRNGDSKKVPYTRDKDNHSIRFKYNNKDFDFRVFHYGDKRILVGKDGLIMVLEEA